MVDLLKSYFNNRIELVKLSLVSVSANIVSKLINSFLMLLFFLMIMLMFSFAASFFIGEALHSFAMGFLIVGGVYFIIFLLFIVFAKDKIERKLKDKVVQISLDAEKEITQE